MPSAETILAASNAAVVAARGSGNAGLAVLAQFGPQVRALIEVVDHDHDPRAT